MTFEVPAKLSLLEQACFDDMVMQDWQWGSMIVVLRRSFDLVWIRFNGDPAVACNEVVAVKDVEAFLAEKGRDDEHADVRAEIGRYLQEVQTPGGSTWVSLIVAAQDDALTLVEVAVADLDHPEPELPLPGPAYAGLYDWPRPHPRLAHLQLLLAPGSVNLHVTATLEVQDRPDIRSRRLESVEAVVAFEALAQQRRDVRVELALGPDGRPSCALFINSKSDGKLEATG